jgi:hypothetical protein
LRVEVGPLHIERRQRWVSRTGLSVRLSLPLTRHFIRHSSQFVAGHGAAARGIRLQKEHCFGGRKYTVPYNGSASRAAFTCPGPALLGSGGCVSGGISGAGAPWSAISLPAWPNPVLRLIYEVKREKNRQCVVAALLLLLGCKNISVFYVSRLRPGRGQLPGCFSALS